MREKVAFRPDEGICFELRIMVCFQLISVPHPPLTWSPLSQLGEGFWVSVAWTLVCQFLVVSNGLKQRFLANTLEETAVPSAIFSMHWIELKIKTLGEEL